MSSEASLLFWSFPDPLQRGIESRGKADPEITFVGRRGDLPLYRMDHLDQGTLGGTIAFGSERDLTAQHGLDRRHRENLVSFPNRHRPICLFDRQRRRAPGRHATGPPAWITGGALAEPGS